MERWFCRVFVVAVCLCARLVDGPAVVVVVVVAGVVSVVLLLSSCYFAGGMLCILGCIEHVIG